MTAERKLRLIVITDADGKLVGTSNVAPEGAVPGGVRARLRAGPDQRAQEIELDVDERLLEGHDAAALHERVRQYLARKSRPASRGR